MSGIYWLALIPVIIVLIRAGIMRPTGLWSRTRAEQQQERERDMAANWLKKDADKNPPA